MADIQQAMLLDSQSSDLVLRHPTAEECATIWTSTSASWMDSLTLPAYLEESSYLTTIPLARDKGMTTWILVDRNLPPNQRPVLCSCESFRKRSLTSDSNGNVRDNIVHGIAGVFCPPEYRGRAFPQRMLQELAKILSSWQTNTIPSVGSILYSDIGKKYYAKLGWHPNTTNTHIEFPPRQVVKSSLVQDVAVEDLEALCKRDEAMVRKAMTIPDREVTARITILPDLNHMLWHIAKEEFACNYLFGRIPHAKGAIVGSPGNQVWVVWTHRYYNHPNTHSKSNVLYILRLVMELDETASRLPSDAGRRLIGEKHEEQRKFLRAVIQAAQIEAAEWNLDIVKLWDPTPLVQEMLGQSNIDYVVVEREEDSIASGLWYNEAGQIGTIVPLWVNNEHYAWL